MKPIILHADEIRGILNGSVNTIWRAIEPQPVVSEEDAKVLPAAWESGFIDVECPYGNRRFDLYVLEEFAWPGEEFVFYHADPSHEKFVAEMHAKHMENPNYPLVQWMPPEEMPRHCSRLTIHIADVLVERREEVWKWGLAIERYVLTVQVAS